MIKIFVEEPEKTEDIMCAALIFASFFTSFQMSEHTQWVLPTSRDDLVRILLQVKFYQHGKEKS